MNSFKFKYVEKYFEKPTTLVFMHTCLPAVLFKYLINVQKLKVKAIKMEKSADNKEYENLMNLFDGFEEKNGTTIPKNIKKTLNIMDYSQFMIANADPETLVQEIEETIKYVLPSIIVEENEIYFGKLYKNCPDKFKFFAGQRALIRDLVRYAFLREKERHKTEKDSKKVLVPGKRKRKNSTEEDNDLEEVEKCKTFVCKWFLKTMKLEIECKVHNLRITENEIQLSVQCPLCSLKYKCHKIKNHSEQGWSLSNLYRHVSLVHINEKETPVSQTLQPISKFFTSSSQTVGSGSGKKSGDIIQ